MKFTLNIILSAILPEVFQNLREVNGESMPCKPVCTTIIMTDRFGGKLERKFHQFKNTVTNLQHFQEN